MTASSTEALFFAGGYSWTETPERGVTVARIDRDSGVPAAVETCTEIPNPFHLLTGPDGRTLYVVSNVAEGQVHALRIEDGTLRPLGERPAGAGPVHQALHPAGGHLVVVNHDSGDVMTYPVEADGVVGPVVQTVKHVQSVTEGADPHAQAGPHPHMAVFDPAGTRLLVPDKGTDHVHIYRFDAETGRSTPQSQVYLEPGFGPRCLVPHPFWKYVYVLGEIQSKIMICGYDQVTGALWTLGTVPTVPDGDEAGNAPSGLVISPDGRFLYAANRGRESIAVFAVQDEGESLEPAGHVQVGEQVTMLPWELRLDAAGTTLYVPNQLAGTVMTFTVDPENGSLRPAETTLKVPGAATVAVTI